jgi:cell division protein FtsI/penicillin-binding protein 2
MPRTGSDLTLTIDSTIQFYVEKYLAQAIKDYDVAGRRRVHRHAAENGEILALASMGSSGSYDLNNFLQLSPEAQAKIDAITDPARKRSI